MGEYNNFSSFLPSSIPHLNQNPVPECSSSSYFLTGWTDNVLFEQPPVMVPEIPRNQPMRTGNISAEIIGDYQMQNEIDSCYSPPLLGPTVDMPSPRIGGNLAAEVGGHYGILEFPSSSSTQWTDNNFCSFLDNTAAEVGGHYKTTQFNSSSTQSTDNYMSSPAPMVLPKEFFGVADLFLDDTAAAEVKDQYDTAPFYSPSTQSAASSMSAPTPMVLPEISFDVAEPFLGNTTAEARTFERTGLLSDAINFDAPRRRYPAVSFPERESAARVHPLNEAAAPRNGGVDSPEIRTTGKAWTVYEHKLFLVGMKIYGRGDWKNIAKKLVISKTSGQVASHAQKFFLRQQSSGQKRKRSSIHDITTVEPEFWSMLRANQLLPPLPPPLMNYPPSSMLPNQTQQCQHSNTSVPIIQQPSPLQPVVLPQQFVPTD